MTHNYIETISNYVCISVSNGWIISENFLEHNKYTGPVRGVRAIFIPVKGPVIKNDIKCHDKRKISQKVPQLLASLFLHNPNIYIYI